MSVLLPYSLGNIWRIDFSSHFATRTVERRRLLRLVSFLVRMWLWKARLRLMRPLPVARKRLAAPRLLFIFGIVVSLFSRFMSPSCSVFRHADAMKIFSRLQSGSLQRLGSSPDAVR